jgi:hypothetical protein
MKIPGKSPLKTITKKLPSLNAQQAQNLDSIVSVPSSKNIVSINTKEILYKKSKKSFSVNILNYVEPYYVKGQRYTLFYTEFDHNLALGDRVFITGGFYDSDLLIQNNKYDKRGDGYMVYYVDRTQVVLDIEYTGDLPWSEQDIDDYLKVYVANTQEEFEYFIQAVSTRDFSYLTRRFSQWGPFSNNNILYINGTFNFRSASTYGILGFDDGLGNTSLSYSDAFLVISGTVSGYLTDVTSNIMANNLPVSFGSKRLVIDVPVAYVPIGGGFRRLFLRFTEPHGITEPTLMTIWFLEGTGNSSFWNGYTGVFSFNTNISLTTDVYDPSDLYDGLLISSGFLTEADPEYNFDFNGSLKIINSDFENSGIKFKKGYPYYFDDVDSTWKVNRLFMQPIITEQNFRNGVFKNGEFNQGLMGTHQEKIIHDGTQVNFTLGTVLNTLWQNGNIGRGEGSDLSYFTTFNEFSIPEIKLNERNNRTFGYNLFYDSEVQRSIIENGLFYRTMLGYNPDGLHTMTDYYTNVSTTFSVTTKYGEYLDCEFELSNIKNSTIISSSINNSKVEKSKSVNSEISRTLFLNSKYNSDKIIKIQAYDERFVRIYDESPALEDYKLYKFYIDKNSYLRLSEFQNFYIDGLEILKSELLNFFDERFTFSEYSHTWKFIYEGYHNLRFENMLVYLSSSDENIKTISNFGVDGNNTLTSNSKEILPSIDVYFRFPSLSGAFSNPKKIDFLNFQVRTVDVPSGPYRFDIEPFTFMTSWGITPSVVEITTSISSFTFSGVTSSESLYTGLQSLLIGSWTYSGDIFEVEGEFAYKSLVFTDATDVLIAESVGNQYQSEEQTLEFNDVVNLNNAYILDSDFKSGLFKDSTWVSGNYMNYRREHSLTTNTSVRYNGEVEDGGPVGKLLSLSSGNTKREKLIELNDIVYLNGFYLDSTIVSGENLVKLPSIYKVSQLTSALSAQTFKIYDLVYGTSSVIYNIPSTSTSQKVFLTPGAENGFNYLHPAKFQNSKINSGIFRKGYFEGCQIYNTQFNNLERNPKNFKNWRSLLLSETIFNDNSNTLKSGLVYNSHWLSGSDSWINGIFYNSTWNVQTITYSNYTVGEVQTTSINKFNDGIFKQSKWIDGVFANGQFYKNNSNITFTASVYSNLVRSNTSSRRFPAAGLPQRTRYSWQNGTFENGIFEESTFESGTFKSGEFFNSTFLTGEASGGNFGKSNLKAELTRVASGSFSSVNVISSEFRAANPNGSIEGNFEINWYSGIFNNGIFGVFVDSASYSTSGIDYSFRSTWYDGVWQNGLFTDTARWKNGKFNNGKFTSYFGYPFVTSASYSSATVDLFAWENGEFNDGQFGIKSTGTNSTWFNGEFNGGIFTGRYWNDGIFTRGRFIGSGIGTTLLSNISNYVSEFSNDFYGLWNSGFVSELKDKQLPNKKFVDKPEREFTRKRIEYQVEIRNALWRGGTFSHNNAVFNNSVWTGGVFEKGLFVNSSFNPYLNYLVNSNFVETIDENGIEQLGKLLKWEVLYSDFDSAGTIIGGRYSIANTNEYAGDTRRQLTYNGTSSIATIYQTAGLIIGDTYTFRMIVRESSNMEVRFGDSTNPITNRNFTNGETNWFIGATSQSLGVQPTVTVSTGSPGYLDYTDTTADGSLFVIYPNILNIGREYFVRFYAFNKTNMDDPYIGSCDSSQVSVDNYVLTTPFVEGISISFSQIGVASAIGTECLYQAVITAEYTDLMINFTTLSSNSQISLNGFNVTSNTGLFNSNINERTAYSYTFNAQGADFSVELIPIAEVSASGPVWDSATISIQSMELVKGESGFNISDSCYWENGTFRNSEFYVSKWYNGKWQSGNAVGMIWKNGVAEYMNAYNVYWEGGLWRNGNWNGSPFGYENITENGCLLSFTESAIDGAEDPNLDAIVVGGDWTSKNMFIDSNLPTYVGGEALVSITILSAALGSFNVTLTDGSGLITNFSTDYRDPSLDPDTSNSYINSFGFPFIQGDPLSLDETYRITVNVGAMTVAQLVDSENIGMQISLGRPGSAGPYGEMSGTYEGSLYPGFKDIVSTEDFVSPYRRIIDLEGHSGGLVEDAVLSGIDGYVSTGGTMVETLVARDNTVFYLHFNLYGVSSLTIDSIIIERVRCEVAAEINEGYVSDILTNVARYRQSVNDTSYQSIFVNNAFTTEIDTTYPEILGSPNVEPGTFTMSSGVVETWEYQSSYIYYQNPSSYPIAGSKGTGGSKGGSTTYIQAFDSGSEYTGGPFWRTFTPGNNTLYVIDENNNLDIFSASGEYEITFRYSFAWADPMEEPTESTYLSKFKVYIGHFPNFDNGGVELDFEETVRVYPVADINSSPLGGFNVQPLALYYVPHEIYTYTITFIPTLFSETSDTSKRMRFRKQNTSSGSRVEVRIHGITITKKSTQYDQTYNNATYSLFSVDPSYDETLNLPDYQKIAAGIGGSLISTKFGNGMFVSGTGSAYSSIWENGVWNNGLRFDNNIFVFEDLSKLSGSSKSDARQAEFEIKSTKSGTLPNLRDDNFSRAKYSTKNWLITLDAIEGYIQFENYLMDQVNYNPSYYFKIGDKVSVGNIVAIDINGNRKLIKDAFTVVTIVRSTKTDTVNSVWKIILSVTINFPIRTIERDSVNHPIYVTKNIWLNGAYLNGLFRGVWTNGLFKGRPYLTEMVDSQWIEGRFDGGQFRGKTASIIDNLDSTEPEITVFPSGLIQNFNFKDNNLSTQAFEFLYNSWIDVNYVNTQAVNLAKRGVISNLATKIDKVTYLNNGDPVIPKSNKWSLNNFYGIPTKDVLSSISYFRNGDDLETTVYSLGWKFKRYEQVIPENGEFLTPFDNFEETRVDDEVIDNDGNTVTVVEGGISEFPGMQSFFDQGWTFSTSLNNTNSLIYLDPLDPVPNYSTMYRLSSNSDLEYPFGSVGNSQPDVPGQNFGRFAVQLNNPESRIRLANQRSVAGQIKIDNTFTKLLPNRYSILEFSLEYQGPTFSHQGDAFKYPLSIYPPGVNSNQIRNYNLIDDFSAIQFDNDQLQLSTFTYSRNGYTTPDGTFQAYSDGERAWPLNHLNNTELVKTEYFFNKPEISLYFYEYYQGIGSNLCNNNYKYFFDFIRYTEVDMIPFFRYATASRITQYPQFPFSAVAPFIDYSNSEFSLIDNVNITEDSFLIQDNIVSVNSSGIRLTGAFDDQLSVAGGAGLFQDDITSSLGLIDPSVFTSGNILGPDGGILGGDTATGDTNQTATGR